MSVWVGKDRFELGDASLLKSLSSTIFLRLEDEYWGSVYPTVMERFYSGRLPYIDADTARRELNSIREGLRRLPPDQVVWDFENPSARPPWGDKISPHITSLANYFVTSDGKDLIQVLDQAFEASSRVRQDATIS
jgi:2,3-bisphosphoglycerate-dependent phosphoglycerate mutase